MAGVIDTEQLHGGWQPIGQGSIGSRIRLEIIRVIRERRLRPGDRLPAERELASILQVSRPSVREAVRALESEGRLVVRHGQGVFVAEPATRRALQASLAKVDHDIAELYAMREVLEVPAARWAAERRDTEGLQLVREALDRLEAALEQRPLDHDTLQRLDAAFHLSIVQASGNRFLEQTQGVLNDILNQGMVTTLRLPGRVEKSREQHRRILEALLVGDVEAAGRAARAHVRATQAAARRHVEDRLGG
jgi:GntR family transcriptional regulator, transcriptional repressor for pyruvate dehydrogenase complex